MKTLDFDFNSDPQHRFPTLDAQGYPLAIVLDRAQGMLRICRACEVLAEFPLTKDGEPCPLAVFQRHTGDGATMMEFGSVDFCGQPEYLEDYPLNDPDIQDKWRLKLQEGGIVILDIRNLGRMISTVYGLDLVPVVLSMTGVYLRIATLKQPADRDLTPWYQQISLPQS